VACLGGECFGGAGAGFLRFSCAEPAEVILEAVAFLKIAIQREDRARAFAKARPEFKLDRPYPD
jgi:aspartate aminotransferase